MTDSKIITDDASITAAREDRASAILAESDRLIAGRDRDVAVFDDLFMTKEVFAKCMPHVVIAVTRVLEAEGVAPEVIEARLGDETDAIHENMIAPMFELAVEILGVAYERMQKELSAFEESKSLKHRLKVLSQLPTQGFDASALPKGSRNRR